MSQPDIGWCPCCNRAVVELPQGYCSDCFNHTMQVMSRYDHESELGNIQQKNEELQKQMANNKAMFEFLLNIIQAIGNQGYKELNLVVSQAEQMAKSGIEFNQATTEAFMREHDAKVLKEYKQTNSKSTAGVHLWMNGLHIEKIITDAEIEHEREQGDSLFRTTQVALNQLAESILAANKE